MGATDAGLQNDWQRYPFRLVPGDPQLDFPAAEGMHHDYESDTWYLAGFLTAESGRRFAFITIFNRNRPGGEVVADFHTFALFDVDHGNLRHLHRLRHAAQEHGGRRPPPKLTCAEGHLDVRYDSSAGTTTWAACRDDAGELIPYTYDYAAFGNDKDGAAMELRLHLTPSRPPVPVGGGDVQRQDRRLHPGRHLLVLPDRHADGRTLSWARCDGVTSPRASPGDSGHIDRQWFPSYAGGGGTGGDPRGQAHEWHTISLDNGVDISVWRQFDRRDRKCAGAVHGNHHDVRRRHSHPSASRTSRWSRPAMCAGPTRFAA